MSHIHCILSHRNRSLFKFRHDALRDPFPHSKCPDKVLAMLLIPARMPLQYPPLNIQMSHINFILSHKNLSLIKSLHDALRDHFPHSKCPDKVLAMLLIPARMPLQYPPLNIQMSHRKLCICTNLLLHIPTMQRFPSDEVLVLFTGKRTPKALFAHYQKLWGLPAG